MKTKHSLVKHFIFVVFFILLMHVSLKAQQVFVNEIMFKPQPALINNNAQALVNLSYPNAGREYIELYNSDCDNPIDISGWVLASEVNVAGSRIGGAFCFPPGTILPAGDFLIIGGPDGNCTVAPNCQPSHAYPAGSFDIVLSNFIGTQYLCVPQNVWLLANGDGWMAIYEPNGTPHSACYWTGNANNITSSTYDGDFAQNPCSPTAYTGPQLRSARQIFQQFPSVINYMGAGTSCGIGNTFSRMPDGGPFQVRPPSIGPTRAQRCNDGTCLACGNLQVTPSPDTCSASVGTLTLIIPDPSVSPGPYSYVVTGPGGYNNSFNTPNTTYVLTGLAAGTYNIQVTDNQSPPATTIRIADIINVGGNLSINATANPSQICAGSSSILTATGANTYSWSHGLGSGSPVTASPTSTTTYTVTGSDAQGCSATASVTVTVAGSINVTATANPSQICIGGSANLTVTGGDSYTWSHGLGTNSSVTVTPATTTTYTVTGSDSQGCSGTASVQVEVLTSLSVTISPANPQICEGDNIQLTATSNGNNPQFLWNTGNTNPSITVNPLSTTTYTVDAEDNLGCTGSAQVTVTVNDIPEVDFAAIPTEGCAPLTVSFQNFSEQNMVYNWNFGNGQSSNLFNPVHSYNSSGNYTVSLTVTNQGCENAMTRPAYIQVYPNPVADFRPSSSVVDEENGEVIFSDMSSGVSSWNWSLGDGIGFSTEQSPVYTYSTQGTYNVCQYVQNQFGCADSICKNIIVKPFVSFYIPNAFSPNGDGINEVFHPFGNNIEPDQFTMRIYDRWGKLVFFTNNFNTGWDGRDSFGNSSMVLPTGVYVYFIEAKFDVGIKEYRGIVTLVY